MNVLSKEKVGHLSNEQKSIYNWHVSLGETVPHQIMDLTLDFHDTDLAIVQKAITYVYSSNDTLRTVILIEENEILQKIEALTNIERFVEYMDCSNDPNPEPRISNRITTLTNSITLKPNSLLCKCALFRLDSRAFRCVFLLHHVISDQWSLFLVEKKLREAIAFIKKRGETIKAKNPNPYNLLDYAKNQNTFSQKKKHTNFWKKKLQNINTETVPILIKHCSSFYSKSASTMDVSEAIQESDGDVLIYKIEGKIKETIDSILKKCNVGLMALTIASFNLLPWYYGWNTDGMLIASPVRNRLSAKNRALIGPCVGGIYTHIKKDGTGGTGKSILMSAYLNLLESMKHMVSDHNSFQIDEKLMREKSDIYLNVVTKDFGVKLNENHYDKRFSTKGISYYPLQCVLYEQEDNICMIWEFRTAFYSSMAVRKITYGLIDILQIIDSSMEIPLGSRNHIKYI